MRTKGKWEVLKSMITNGKGRRMICQWTKDIKEMDQEAQDNAAFIALAGTVANYLDEQGIDGEKAIEKLPFLIGTLEFMAKHPDLFSAKGCKDFLSQLKLKTESLCKTCLGFKKCTAHQNEKIILDCPFYGDKPSENEIDRARREK